MRLWVTSLVVFILAASSSSLLAQGVASVSNAVSPGEAVPHETVLMTQAVFAFMASWVMEWWKDHPKLGGLSQFSQIWVQRLVAIVVAAGTSIGIGYNFDPAAGTLVITGLTWSAILWTAWESFKQFVMQEFAYRAAFKKEK